MNNPKFKVGDVIVASRSSEWKYEIMEINKYHYKLRVLSCPHLTEVGKIIEPNIEVVEKEARKVTKLEKILK